MRIGIMLPDLVPHDAVGNDALGMYISLKAAGHECYIFTRHGETRHPLIINRYSDIPIIFTSPDDLLIYHYCVADHEGITAIRRASARVILRYHNVTPASFMMQYSREFAVGCKLGRQMLTHFGETPLIGVLSDSKYNWEDLTSIIAPEVPMAVLPPLHRVSELLGMPDDPGMQNQIGMNWFNILTVGRVVPNKALEVMLDHFASAREDGLAGMHLHFVGGRDPRLAAYWSELDLIVERRGLQGSVTWHHGLSAQRLATLYRHCDLFWTTSQHEGFCVPVVEAMGFGLPVMSSRKGALPETCGDAALFADQRWESVNNLRRLVTNDVFRMQLGEQGKERYAEVYRASHLERSLAEYLNAFCERSAVVLPAAEVCVGEDWFGLPGGSEIAAEALRSIGSASPLVVTGSDRRKTLIDWVIREGVHRSEKLAAIVGSPDFHRYAQEIEVPMAAVQLTPAMRLAWVFDPTGRTSFSLRRTDEVGHFIDWYGVFAKADYEAGLAGDYLKPAI